MTTHQGRKLGVLGTLLLAGLCITAASSAAARMKHEPLPPQPRAGTFDHVIIIFQENRTPDNLFYGLCVPPFGSANRCSTTPGPGQYDIQTSNWLDYTAPGGTRQPVAGPLANKFDLGHSHQSWSDQCHAPSPGARCVMDGAAKVACRGQCAPDLQFEFVDNSTGIVNPYLELATQYGWANAMFQSNQGPSYPAHQFMFGGTSAPESGDDAKGIFASENVGGRAVGGSNVVAGCTAKKKTTVQLIDPTGENRKIYPCFEHATLPDKLPANVSWRYYSPRPTRIWTAPNSIRHICRPTGFGGKCVGPEWKKNLDFKVTGVLDDIDACKLRSVSWVIPTGPNSDHARASDGGGPSWVASIVNEIGHSNCDGGRGYWKNTAIIITWDDWGGWYDHVPAPLISGIQKDYQYGFRVPLVIVSAYTPKGYVNNVPHDFGSVLRFVEHNFGVTEGVLTFDDARATSDLTAFFDFGQPARVFKPIVAPKSTNFFKHDKRPATDPDEE